MRVYVFKDKCIGCGLCATLCPDVFEMGPEGASVVMLAPIPEEREDAVDNTALSCPVEAIDTSED